MNLRRIFNDLLRVSVLLLAVGALLYQMDESNIVVFQAGLIGVFLVGVTHLTRRILFPNLDLQAIAIKAIQENSVPGVIIFCAIVYFLVSVLQISVGVLK